MNKPPLYWPLYPYTQRRCTYKWKTSRDILKTLLTITLSALLHLKKISPTPLKTKEIKVRHSYSLTTPILNLRPHQPLNFILRLTNIISLLKLGQKRVLPPLPLPLHPHPTQSSLQTPYQIPLKKHQNFSPYIHLTIQGDNLRQFQIIHQMTLPELTLHTFHKLLQPNYIHNNLHQLFPPPQKSTLPVEIHQACLIYFHLSIHQNNLPQLFFCTKRPLSQWISLKFTIYDPIWHPNVGYHPIST